MHVLKTKQQQQKKVQRLASVYIVLERGGKGKKKHASIYMSYFSIRAFERQEVECRGAYCEVLGAGV